MISVEDRLILEAAAKLDPSFAKKYGLGAASDYKYEGFAITNYPQGVVPGDAVFVDVAGKVTDINAGFPDAWQVVVAGAVVDDSGKPTNLRDFSICPSRTCGDVFPYHNVIVITTGWQPPHAHLVLGVMGTSSINVVVQLFANHSDSPSWDWSQWQYPNGPAPTNGWDFLAKLQTASPINPPSKAPNWLLIGGIAGAAFLTVAVVIVVKKK